MTVLRVLVACECSGIVREAFRSRGHDAWSADLKPAEDGSRFHIQGDARLILGDGWDMLIAHPVCRRMTNAGVRWLKTPPPGRSREEMWAELDEGTALFSAFWNANIEKVAIENPIMHHYAKARIVNFEPAAQTVQPWWFGDKTFKGTSWWLRGLPLLVATDRLTPPAPGTDEHKRWSWVHRMTPGPEREAARSRFHAGMANAMAAQWGGPAAQLEMFGRAA